MVSREALHMKLCLTALNPVSLSNLLRVPWSVVCRACLPWRGGGTGETNTSTGWLERKGRCSQYAR